MTDEEETAQAQAWDVKWHPGAGDLLAVPARPKVEAGGSQRREGTAGCDNGLVLCSVGDREA